MLFATLQSLLPLIFRILRYITPPKGIIKVPLESSFIGVKVFSHIATSNLLKIFTNASFISRSPKQLDAK